MLDQVRTRKIDDLKHSIAIRDKYILLAQERETQAREGYLYFDDGKRIPIISDLSKYKIIHRWKQRRKELLAEKKQLEQELKLLGAA